MTKKLTTSLFAIAAIAAAGFGFNSLNNETPSELANAAVTQNTEVAMVGNGMWIWEGWTSNEEIQTDAETQIAFDHRPCLEGNPKYRWGNGIFGKICVLQYNKEELNAFDAEEQIAFDPISRGESCWIRDYEPVPCPSDSWNAEDVNAFEVEEQIAFDLTPCHQKRKGYRWGKGIFGTTCAWEGNSEELNAFEAEEQIAEGAQCIWQGYTVDCDTLDADAQVIATANPYTQDANPADTVDATSGYLETARMGGHGAYECHTQCR